MSTTRAVPAAEVERLLAAKPHYPEENGGQELYLRDRAIRARARRETAANLHAPTTLYKTFGCRLSGNP